MLTLEVLISTCRPEGILKVAEMSLPRIGGVYYLVSWQDSEDAPVPDTLEGREDVRVVRNEVKCLSDNRNFAFGEARGDILLVADDDLIFSPAGLFGVIEAFTLRPSMHVALFRFEGTGKRYPDVETRLDIRWPKDYYVSSIEIALRRSCLSDNRLRFLPDFGLGARYGCGEEELFVMTAIRTGRDVRFIPHTVCCHPAPSTGSNDRISLSALRGSGAVIGLLHPLTAYMRIPIKALRGARAGRMRFFPALAAMTASAIRARFTITLPWKK